MDVGKVMHWFQMILGMAHTHARGRVRTHRPNMAETLTVHAQTASALYPQIVRSITPESRCDFLCSVTSHTGFPILLAYCSKAAHSRVMTYSSNFAISALKVQSLSIPCTRLYLHHPC